MNSSHRETHRVNKSKVPVRIGSEADATPSIDQNPKNLLFRRYHILVKGFSGRMTEDALQRFYSNFGDIIRCQIRNVGVGAKEAHAHVVFSSKEAMNHALKTLPHIINDEKVSAKVGTNKDELTLRLLNLSPETTEKSLKKFYSRFGSLNQCEVKKDSETGESTMGYVSFASQHELDRALDAQPHFIDGSEVFLKYLTGELDLRSKNVPEGITEESLRTYFSRYGQLRHCELFKTAKGINIAHLSFSSVNEVNEAFKNGPHKIEGALVRVQRPTSKKDRLKKGLLFESDELIDMVGEPEANKNRSIPESRKVNMELNPTQARLQKHLESDGYSKVAENTSISAPEVRHTQVNNSSTQTRLQRHLESDEKSKVALNTSISAPEVCLSENTISITIPIGFIKSLPDMVNGQDANRTISITGTMPTQSKALNITQSSKNAIQSSKNLEFRRYHIVVRGFSENVTVDMLREFYSRFGEVIRCEIKKHRNGEMSAVVVFSSKKAMNRAWMTVSNHINKEKVFLTGAPDSHELTLRLLNLSPETTEESLRKFGKVKYCEVNKNSRSGETLPSYVSFASHEDLDRALDAQPHFIDGSEVFLKYATGDLDLEIKNVPEGITEESLRTFFSKYGQLRQCELPKISNGLYTGFVSFSAINEVNRAMEDRPHVIDRKILKTDFVGKSGLFPIFVGRIPKNATLMSLVKTFSKFGKIVHLEMGNDGHGFVSYGTWEEADKALNTPQHMVEGAVVNVQIVTKKTDKFKKQ
ncbi:RNA recognition motif domain-containing protein [Ditylenchus destructor]|nr:RNA recognition motif domain-containing protein [Ditylenchus destructor]